MRRCRTIRELYLVTTAMHHYAKGMAHAALKNFREAEKQRRLFDDSLRRMPTTRRFFNNMAHDMFGVGEKMLDGELQYHLGNHDVGLRASAARACAATTTSSTLSPGPGCTLRGTRWRPSCRSRDTTTRPSRSIATTWV